MTKNMTLRLDDEQAEILELMAMIDGDPMSEIIHYALSQHIATRRADPEFQVALKDYIRRASSLLMPDGQETEVAPPEDRISG